MPGGWKLVIVDNASTDGTRDVIRQFESSLPVMCCEEPLAGKNRALLRGLREAEGDLIVFSDDDATPDSEWLTALRRAADERLDFDIFGGAIRPRWEIPPEPWVLDRGPFGVLHDHRSGARGRSGSRQIGLGAEHGPSAACVRSWLPV